MQVGAAVSLHPLLNGCAGEGRQETVQIASVGIDSLGTPRELAQAQDERLCVRGRGDMRIQLPPDLIALHAHAPTAASLLIPHRVPHGISMRRYYDGYPTFEKVLSTSTILANIIEPVHLALGLALAPDEREPSTNGRFVPEQAVGETAQVG